ncbi:MAG TPA: STAS domain-containing protein [Pirellulales bacterium]|jgi:anti-anti-sigma factor|nr:STAS domain-containing protein [Pirellulales bacterium]
MTRIQKQEGITVLEIGTEYDSLDVAKINEFGGELLAAVAEAEPPKVLLDLRATTFIGSSFLGLLIRAWKRLRDRQGTLALCHVNDVCGEVLHASKLDMIWQVFPDRDAAIGHLHRNN